MAEDLYSSTHSTLRRITEIHRRLLPPSQLPTSKTLAKAFGVSSKTIQRDLKFMKEVWGSPVRYNASLGGYEYYEGVIDFPAVKLTEEEIFAFLVARNSIERYRGPLCETHLPVFTTSSFRRWGCFRPRECERSESTLAFAPPGGVR
jgi:predicted DNA-binding transcriptional regulator YafY